MYADRDTFYEALGEFTEDGANRRFQSDIMYAADDTIEVGGRRLVGHRYSWIVPPPGRGRAMPPRIVGRRLEKHGPQSFSPALAVLTVRWRDAAVASPSRRRLGALSSLSSINRGATESPSDRGKRPHDSHATRLE